MYKSLLEDDEELRALILPMGEYIHYPVL